MSTASGISASQALLDEYARAIDDVDVRFLRITIQKESLVASGTWKKSSPTLAEDLSQLYDALESDVPAYVLGRIDAKDWLFISYVPETAQIRDKASYDTILTMLYASSRSAVTKALGGQAFKETLFATSKADLTPNAYAAHLRHINSPQPMSSREAELAEIQATERQSGSAYEGSRGRKNHVGAGVGVNWAPNVESAIKQLAEDGPANLLVLAIDPETETLQLTDSRTVAPHDLPSALPKNEPSYAFYRWQPSKIIFIYACPSSSKVKLRMIYSSAVSSLVQTAQDTGSFKVFRKLETSDPSDLDLSFAEAEETQAAGPSARQAFARPKGPPRKR